MKLTELHSGRIEAAIREALRKATRRHNCTTGPLLPGEYDDDEDGDGSVAIEEIHVPSVARAILSELQTLEAKIQEKEPA